MIRLIYLRNREKTKSSKDFSSGKKLWMELIYSALCWFMEKMKNKQK